MRIKQLFIGLGLSCALVMTTSCENVLEVEPEFQLDGSRIFTNLNDYEFALTGAYSLLRQVGYYGNGAQTTGSWSTLPDMMADNVVQTAEDLANFQELTNLQYTADAGDIGVTWLAAYRVISQANIVIRNIDQFSGTNQGRVNRLKGQALALRAMAHFDLLRYWGESFDRNSTALGVPYKTVVDAEDLPSRLTVKETYDNIFRDMQEAETMLGNVDRPINAGASRAFIDQLVVKALLARINLYAKDYNAAASYATEVIEARPLATRAQFPGIWTDANRAEVIWSIAFSAGEGSPGINLYTGPGNRNRYRPSTPLLNQFNEENDIRYNAYFGTRALAGTPRTVIVKYLGRTAVADNLVDWKVLRTGEMYLIRAEARALGGATGAVGALADLNALRAARIANYVPVVLAGQALIDAIALERRKELFAEGHRWFDLKRTTRTIDRTGDCGLNSTPCQIGPDAREWAWPIPQTEIDTNPNIAGQQTSGY